MAEAVTPAVTVLVISYNSGAVISDCLRSIGGAVPILVVDNASADDTLERVADFPAVRVLRNTENVGFGGAVNIGLGAIDSPLILLLNPDVRIHARDIAVLQRTATQHPQAAVIGPALFYPAGVKASVGYQPLSIRPIDSLFNPLFRLHRWKPPTSASVAAQRVSLVIGAAMLLRRSAMAELGGFDPQVFMYFDEWDLCLRARLAGWDVLRAPSASALHLGGGSSPGLDAARREEIVHWHFSWSRFYMAIKWRCVALLEVRLACELLRVVLRAGRELLHLVIYSVFDLLCFRAPDQHHRVRWRGRIARLSGAWAACLGQPSSRGPQGLPI